MTSPRSALTGPVLVVHLECPAQLLLRGPARRHVRGHHELLETSVLLGTKLSWSCCDINVITKCALFSHYNLDICKNREMLKCSDKESGRGCCNLSVWWGCALCSWRCKSPWNRYCRFHPCRRSWRSGRRRPWRCRRGESWSTSPGSCPCSAGRRGSPAWSLCNATTTHSIKLVKY